MGIAQARHGKGLGAIEELAEVFRRGSAQEAFRRAAAAVVHCGLLQRRRVTGDEVAGHGVFASSLNGGC